MNDITRPWARFYNKEAAALDLIETAPHISVEDLIRSAAQTHAANSFVTTVLPNGASATLSYSEIETASRSVALYLRETLGLKAGDVVAIQAPNCIGYVVCMIGVLRAGLILSNVNPLYTPTETRRQLEDCGAKALFFIDVFGDKIEEAVNGLKGLHLIKLSLVDFFPPLRKMLLHAALKYARKMIPSMTAPHIGLDFVLKEHPQQAFSSPLPYETERPDDATNFYQYSGGTTGRSKGVELTFSALMHNVDQVGSLEPDLLQQDAPQSLLVLPLYHMFGCFAAMSGLKHGGHTVLVPSPRPLKNVEPAFRKFPPDIFPGVNTLFAQLLKEDWFISNPPRIKLTVTGATALNSAVAKEWKDITGSEIIEAYGMTEATTVLTTNPLADRMRAGSVGFPAPGSLVKILNDHHEWAAPNEPGEIVARGPQIMKGYFNAPEENETAFHQGWLRTGDIGYLDEDGYLYLVDRKKDMIIVSGFKVFPNEVEEALTQHKDVSEAGVVGIEDKEMGEKIVAFIVAKNQRLEENHLREHCAGMLTNYKRPREYRFVDELPKTPVGKVLRRSLRDDAMQAPAS